MDTHDFFQIIKRKHIINEQTAESICNRWKTRIQWNSHKIYLEEMQNEIKEMEEELKKDNSVYLEDELGDIFWDYLNLIYSLEKEWYILKENIFTRCKEKFWERVTALEDWRTWEEIKLKQKQKLKEEHSTKYNH